MSNKEQKIKLSKKQENVIYILKRDTVIFLEDFHHKTCEGLIKKGIIQLEPGSAFKYILTEKGNSYELS